MRYGRRLRKSKVKSEKSKAKMRRLSSWFYLLTFLF
jgi:hypothetical protein